MAFTHWRLTYQEMDQESFIFALSTHHHFYTQVGIVTASSDGSFITVILLPIQRHNIFLLVTVWNQMTRAYICHIFGFSSFPLLIAYQKLLLLIFLFKTYNATVRGHIGSKSTKFKKVAKSLQNSYFLPIFKLKTY